MPGQQYKGGTQGSGSSPGLGSWHGHPLSSARQDGRQRGAAVENQVRARPAAHLQHIVPKEARKALCAACSLEYDAPQQEWAVGAEGEGQRGHEHPGTLGFTK